MPYVKAAFQNLKDTLKNTINGDSVLIVKVMD